MLTGAFDVGLLDGLLGVAGMMTFLVMTGIIPENSLSLARTRFSMGHIPNPMLKTREIPCFHHGFADSGPPKVLDSPKSIPSSSATPSPKKPVNQSAILPCFSPQQSAACHKSWMTLRDFPTKKHLVNHHT